MDKLQRILCYQFNNQSLLVSALSHRSYASNNNERLEFLGDSVLGFVVSELLYQTYPDDNEGKLSRYRSILVRGETLAEIAKELQIGEYLLLGAGELKSGGFRRHSILADAVEAIIGAILLDSNLVQVKQCLKLWYKDRIDIVHQKIIKDPKSRLQELLQSRKLSLPQYKVVKIEGKEHEQSFTVECKIKELDLVFIEKGNSRRIAEQKTAEKAYPKVTNKLSA
ncbi:MAG: ribonuclease III [Gammaproteobacteria bacterium]|nr:ribonuclease III [Gammaproteobacteria bacterium]